LKVQLSTRRLAHLEKPSREEREVRHDQLINTSYEAVHPPGYEDNRKA
jgi:hypothetical protein